MNGIVLSHLDRDRVKMEIIPRICLSEKTGLSILRCFLW